MKNCLVSYLKRNQFESVMLRWLFRRWYDIDVGQYSYGCFDPARFPSGLKIGRYCSFATTCNFFSRNHGLDFISLHPYLYNSNLGIVKKDTIQQRQCRIEDDVWVGHNAIILPSVGKVGRGAVIAAGSVVTKDVPRYAIVAGNPAKVIRYRFNENVIKQIENSAWWMLDKKKISNLIKSNPMMMFEPEKFYEQ